MGQSNLWQVGLEAVGGTILAADEALSRAMNAAARRVSIGPPVVGRLASWLAGLEVLLMLILGLAGRRRSAASMLGAVGLVYLGSEVLGRVWPRQRPFARLSEVQVLTPHSPERSFPSRHVASGLAMAVVGGQAHPRLGTTMAAVAWLLGVSRVAAGLHYPSDVLGGAFLGSAIGRLNLRVGHARRRRS